jgi:predicted RNase H-like nuclease (RuvC/YqgF family)
MEPGERRLLSYGTDVAVLVDSEFNPERGAVTRMTAQRSVFIYETETREERVRENIQALGGSSEERNLVQRYVRQLEQQGDRLEVLRRELEERGQRLATLQAELQELIEGMTFEIDPAR